MEMAKSNYVNDSINPNLFEGSKEVLLIHEGTNSPVRVQNTNEVLHDGVYVLDKGDGWILGESSFLSSQILNPGETGTFSQSVTKSREFSVNVSFSVGFTLDFVEASVEYGFGITIGEESTIEKSVSTTADSDEYVYYKVYATYRKYQVLRVAHGQLVDDGSIYKLTGIWLSKTSAPTREGINQASLLETGERCILTIPSSSVEREILDLAAATESINLTDGLNLNPFGNLYSWTSNGSYPWTKKLNLNITITDSGQRYRILASKTVDFSLYSNNMNNLVRLSESLGDGTNEHYVDISLDAGQYVLAMKANTSYSGNYNYGIIFQKF